VGRQHELELATAELERAQERLMALEREKQQLVTAAGDKPESDKQGTGLVGRHAPLSVWWCLLVLRLTALSRMVHHLLQVCDKHHMYEVQCCLFYVFCWLNPFPLLRGNI
jgi:hypothetical protein